MAGWAGSSIRKDENGTRVFGRQRPVTHPRTRLYTGLNEQGLEALAGHQNVASEFDFDKKALDETLGRTRRIYQLCLVDSAEDGKRSLQGGVSASDALMIVGSCNAEGGLAVETTVDWLAARRGHELLKRSVIVLNDAHRSRTRSSSAMSMRRWVSG